MAVLTGMPGMQLIPAKIGENSDSVQSVTIYLLHCLFKQFNKFCRRIVCKNRCVC